MAILPTDLADVVEKGSPPPITYMCSATAASSSPSSLPNRSGHEFMPTKTLTPIARKAAAWFEYADGTFSPFGAWSQTAIGMKVSVVGSRCGYSLALFAISAAEEFACEDRPLLATVGAKTFVSVATAVSTAAATIRYLATERSLFPTARGNGNGPISPRFVTFGTRCAGESLGGPAPTSDGALPSNRDAGVADEACRVSRRPSSPKES